MFTLIQKNGRTATVNRKFTRAENKGPKEKFQEASVDVEVCRKLHS